MRERPILFSAPIVRALLDGSKTQTRRPCKPMNAWVAQECREVRSVDGVPHHFLKGALSPMEKLRCPYGQHGDRLWVRETWAPHPDFSEIVRRGVYRADSECKYDVARWRPSIHMPRWASRILLEITSVRVERLNDISAADAMAEGVEPHELRQFALYGLNAEERAAMHRDAAVGPFSGLWESINGAGSWAANPWVWVVEFKRMLP